MRSKWIGHALSKDRFNVGRLVQSAAHTQGEAGQIGQAPPYAHCLQPVERTESRRPLLTDAA